MRTKWAARGSRTLLALPSERTYEGWKLYSSLEPCHMCLAAAFQARVGTASFASRNAYGGAVGKLVPSRDHVARPLRVEGPLDCAAGLLPELLLIRHFLWRSPDGDVVRFYREEQPGLVAAAEELPPPDGNGTLPGAYATAAAAVR